LHAGVRWCEAMIVLQELGSSLFIETVGKTVRRKKGRDKGMAT
jgi:hypothetical protein